MKKVDYFFSYNGLYFGFDSILHNSHKPNQLAFELNGKSLCQLDLSVSKFVFDFKSIPTNTYYFKIVPIEVC